ncbi:glycosyltransferase family 2 protein [Candidatus Giovannonibacteria bacterium]|nr:glycosyltransferase family 2 protein [Candidatus Giovannonibacteria bacterium]
MQQPDIYLSVIIPAYNEAEKITKTLRRIQEYFSERPYTYEIIVAADGPRDNTIEIAKKLSGEIKNLRILDRRKNKGKGFTVKEGMLAAKGKIRLFMDADNGTDISHFDMMRPLFDKGCDVVISSRDSKDAPGARQEVAQSFLKRLAGNAGNLFIQIVAVPGIWDTQNGFKAFRDYAAEKIFRKARINKWTFDVEILALARKFNYKIGIIPAHWVNDPRSSVKFSAYLLSLLEVIKIRWNIMRGKYNI